MGNSSVAECSVNNQTLPATNSTCDHSSFGLIFLPVSYSILFLLTIAGNVRLLYHYLRRNTSSSMLFTGNLAILDLLMALTLPLTVDYRLQGSDWRFGDTLCRASIALFYGNLYGGSLFMLCISVDRLLAVRYPQIYETWVLNCQPDGRKTCGDHFPDKQWDELPRHLLLATVFGFLLPYSAILTCYALIGRHLATAEAGRQRWKLKTRRAIITIVAIMTVCFLPFHTVQMVTVVRRLNMDPAKVRDSKICFCQRSLVLMASLNSAFDPFVYYFISYSLNINQLCRWRCN
ncbi:hypothetical protein COCON_G00052670 [Conger conger]|uniref:G-protein coupled receptors family 1 profile domain-containing protein n=1 Tax=Conger conger TaxID=82655 RepID=A0A9Q1I5S9_CONCO|nr:hypothetical protein COCON_G00052670 [Conger conger]